MIFATLCITNNYKTISKKYNFLFNEFLFVESTMKVIYRFFKKYIQGFPNFLSPKFGDSVLN